MNILPNNFIYFMVPILILTINNQQSPVFETGITMPNFIVQTISSPSKIFSINKNNVDIEQGIPDFLGVNISEKTKYIYKYDDIVQKWAIFAKENHEKSLLYAKNQNFNFIKELIKNLAANIDNKKWIEQNYPSSYNRDLVLFLNTLNTNEFNDIVNNVVETGTAQMRPPKICPIPFSRSYSSLSDTQKNLLNSYLEKRKKAKSIDLDKVTISISSSEGVGIDLSFKDQKKVLFSGLVCGGSYNFEKLSELTNTHFYLLMSKLDTPEKSLLGAKLTRKGPDKFVIGDNISIKIPEDKPQTLTDCLSLIATQTKLKIFSDYFTSSKKIKTAQIKGNQLSLEDIAKYFDVIFRIENGNLYCKHIFWPVLSDIEVPYPHPERWIENKSKKLFLSFDNFLSMTNFPEKSILALYEYRMGKISFQYELECLFGMPHLQGSELLKPVLIDIKNLLNDKLIDLRSIVDLVAHDSLRRDVDIFLKSKNIPGSAKYIHIFQEDDDHGCILRIIDEKDVVVFQQNIPANL